MSRSSKITAPDIKVYLPIVPMLDMSFQLLFFFIITFNPGQREGQMAMNLPATGEAKAKKQEDVDLNKQSDTELDIASDFVVSVKYYEQNVTVAVRDSEKVYDIGKIADMDKLTRDEQRKEVDKLLAKLTDKLKEKLEEKKKERKEGDKPNDNVKIEANSKMKYSMLVGVMDACIKAGYSQVGFAPPPDLGS
jgi:biopolymer transport protein ExbD